MHQRALLGGSPSDHPGWYRVVRAGPRGRAADPADPAAAATGRAEPRGAGTPAVSLAVGSLISAAAQLVHGRHDRQKGRLRRAAGAHIVVQYTHVHSTRQLLSTL